MVRNNLRRPAQLCRREGINQNLYCRRSKEFLEAGKKRLAGDTAREANTDEVKELRSKRFSLEQMALVFNDAGAAVRS